jgi:hypothetical protein
MKARVREQARDAYVVHSAVRTIRTRTSLADRPDHRRMDEDHREWLTSSAKIVPVQGRRCRSIDVRPVEEAKRMAQDGYLAIRTIS